MCELVTQLEPDRTAHQTCRNSGEATTQIVFLLYIPDSSCMQKALRHFSLWQLLEDDLSKMQSRLNFFLSVSIIVSSSKADFYDFFL